MYRVLCDGLPIYDLRDEELVLLDPKVTLEVNTAGSFEFKLPPGHPQYDLPKKMKSLVEVWHDDEQIFAGRPTTNKVDFYKRRYIKCEGQLAYLNDSIQRPAEYHDMTVRGYLETLINVHNAQVDESKRFEVGIVTVTDNNDSLYRYTNYNNTMKEIKEDLIDDLGGYLRVRNHNGHRYIDYIAEFDNLCSQSIQFGENLLDYASNVDVTDIATAVIPLGARLEKSSIAALEERLTIKVVNKGVDYLKNDEAVKKYGFIVKTVTWDNVTTPEMLKNKGEKWLTDEQFEDMVLEVKAVDLHYTDEQIEQFKLYDMIPVHSTPHGLNRNFPLSKMTINLNSPASNTFTLGTTIKVKLSTKTDGISSNVGDAIDSIPLPSTIVQQAIDQATALITAATRGNIVTTGTEQLIMDTKDVNTARRVWRWNLNGLGYSSTGYNGTYETAITMDGQIVGKRIVANSISGDKLDISYRTEVRQEIADAEEAAKQDAADYTDGKLKNYYTKSQVETSIKNTKDAVLLSAKEEAVQYVDGKLKNYSTAAQIKVVTDAIRLEVGSKVGSSEVSSLIEQKANSIRLKASSLAWESTYSSMTSSGKLTCTGAIINGDFESNQAYSKRVTIKDGGLIRGYQSSKLCGLLDLAATYDDNKRHVSLKGYDYLHLQAGTSIKVENAAYFSSTTSFTGKSTFNTAPKMFGLAHVSSGGHIVFGSDGATLAYLASSSKRYKTHVREMDSHDAEKILGIPVVWYQYKLGYLRKDDNLYMKDVPGFYAEDVEKAIPEAVQYNKQGEVEDWNYRVLIPFIVKVLQNHQKYFDAMKGLNVK